VKADANCVRSTNSIPPLDHTTIAIRHKIMTTYQVCQVAEENFQETTEIVYCYMCELTDNSRCLAEAYGIIFNCWMTYPRR
jgi:hypothetical protein